MSRLLVIASRETCPLRQDLVAEGHEVVVAAGGGAGYEAARDGNFDLILLDVDAGSGDPFALLRRLRSLPSPTPVILLSDGGGEEERVRALSLGADDYLARPLGPCELCARIRARARAGRRLALLNGAITEAARNDDLGAVLSALLDRALSLTGAERGLILLADRSGKLSVEAARGRDVHLRYSASTVRRVFESGQAEALLDGDDAKGSVLELKLRRVMCAPLESRGRCAGVLYVDSRLRADTFGRSDLTLFRALAAQCGLALERAMLRRVTREKRRLEREVRAAASVQRAMLAPPPPRRSAMEIAGLTRPCAETGGDYLDYLAFDDRRVGLAMGDAAGHGLPAALCMTAARSLVRAFWTSEATPAPVLGEVNRGVARDMGDVTFMSLFLADVDTQTGALRYAAAGQAAMVYRAAEGVIEELPPTGPALGLVAQVAYTERRPAPLRAGDLLVLFTDGVSEARNRRRELFGTERLKRLVGELAPQPAPQILQGISEALRRFRSGRRPGDATSLLVVKAGPICRLRSA